MMLLPKRQSIQLSYTIFWKHLPQVRFYEMNKGCKKKWHKGHALWWDALLFPGVPTSLQWFYQARCLLLYLLLGAARGRTVDRLVNLLFILTLCQSTSRMPQSGCQLFTSNNWNCQLSWWAALQWMNRIIGGWYVSELIFFTSNWNKTFFWG